LKLAIVCDEQLKNEFLSREISDQVYPCFVDVPEQVPDDSDIIFDLLFEHTSARISQLKKFLPRPVFINAVEDTLSDIAEPFIRINSWPTFLQRKTTELVCLPSQEDIVKQVLEQINWSYLLVPDKAGMVSVRIIAGIINEAYYALGEKISSRAEIDTAMKAGTHYPYGPFEWGALIGLKKIHNLLVKVDKERPAMLVAPLLTQEAFSEAH